MVLSVGLETAIMLPLESWAENKNGVYYFVIGLVKLGMVIWFEIRLLFGNVWVYWATENYNGIYIVIDDIKLKAVADNIIVMVAVETYPRVVLENAIL